jgi:SIR2-like domain
MAVRAQILGEIRETIRWGYVHAPSPADRLSGKSGKSIVEIAPHLQFMEALFDGLLAARDRRLRPVEFFTTNYDTLIEDALALRGIPYVDGFRGGAVGYWDHSVYLDSGDTGSGLRANVTKIHGSIDWALTQDQKIVRRRIGDVYPSGGDGGEVLIYPQATKYEFVRREPFDSLFQRFRSVLTRNAAQVLFVCGYGFGDEHVNRELEEALARIGSQLTLVALTQQRGDRLTKWGARSFGERVYVLSEDGAWCGNDGPYLKGAKNWWTFEGMTALVRRGGRAA